MTVLPARHHRRSHAALLAELVRGARAAFVRDGRPAWDPGRRSGDGEIDLGRGLLDSFAVALHVLWTYQQAWAEESFLATARLDASIDKLLAHVGYRPRPGVAAVGVQHLRCRANAPGIVGAGFAVTSPAKGSEQDVTFETLEPVAVDPLLEELRAFLPPPAPAPAPPAEAPGFPSDVDGEPGVPGSTTGPLGAGDALSALQARLDASRHGPLAARRAARAKAKARHLASLVGQLELDGNAACKGSLDALCEELCAAQELAADPAPAATGTLSESQEIIARQLRLLDKRNADAIAALEGVLARCPGETDAAYARRLDQMTAFLDGFVGSLIQEARDQLVLLRGPSVFSRLDDALAGGGAPERGRAPAGTDGLYLSPIVRGDAVVDPPVHIGDWLVIGEEVTRLGADGRASTERQFHEAVRVVRVTREVPAGETAPMVRILFQPALARSYDLDRTIIVGNNAPISEGKTVIEQLALVSGGRTAVLGQAPLTWLRDPSATRGRIPELGVTIAGRAWRRVDDLLAAGPNDPVFAVEPSPGGGWRLRFGDGESGARVPAGAAIVARYRIGLGAGGVRAAGRIDGLAAAHPSIEGTINLLPTLGGADPEPRAGARELGPTAIGAIDRAISLADVVALARAYDGVARARADRDPRVPRRIVVVVAGPDRAALAPADLAALAHYLRLRVPPGLHVVVENRVLVPVSLSLLVRYRRGADPIKLLRDVRARLGIDPGTAAGVLDARRVELGDDLPLSALYEALDGLTDLHSAVVRALHRAGEPSAVHPRIITSTHELLAWADGDAVAIAYEEGRDL